MSICSCNGRTFEETKNQVLCFKDYENGELVPDREEALSNIKSGTCVPELFSNVKAALLTDIGSENIYSEDEIIIGRWIDGKPIYRKVLKGTANAADGAHMVFANIAHLNVEAMIKISGFCIGKSAGEDIYTPIPSNYIGIIAAGADSAISSGINFQYFAKAKNLVYRLKGYHSAPIFLILEYTKA